MAGVPARCPHCGLIFTSRQYSFGGSRGLQLRGNTEECPSCGQDALLADGIFDVVGEVIKVVSAPQMTYEMLAHLQRLAEQSLAKGDDDGEFLAAVEAVHPDVARALRPKVRLSGRTLLAAVMLLAVIKCTGQSFKVNIDATVDVNRAIDQVVSVLSHDSSGSERPKD